MSARMKAWQAESMGEYEGFAFEILTWALSPCIIWGFLEFVWGGVAGWMEKKTD